MKRKDKRIVVVCIVVLMFLIIDFFTAIKTYMGYNKSKASGNERWKQVEERIVKIETDIENLKVEVDGWKN